LLFISSLYRFFIELPAGFFFWQNHYSRLAPNIVQAMAFTVKKAIKIRKSATK
jgi:hypothetical protein